MAAVRWLRKRRPWVMSMLVARALKIVTGARSRLAPSRMKTASVGHWNLSKIIVAPKMLFLMGVLCSGVLEEEFCGATEETNAERKLHHSKANKIKTADFENDSDE